MPRAAGAFWPFSVTRASDGASTVPMVHDSSLDLLDAAVNSDPNPAKGRGGIATTGGSALIAYTGPDGTIADIDRTASSGRISTYTVRDGDSLSGIADMFDVSMNTILWANNLSDKGAVRPGMTLVILPVSGIRHKVASGETLATLAKRYGSDADEIASFNGLSSSGSLASGDTVIIPGGEIAAAKAPAKAKAKTATKIKTGGSLGAVLGTGNTSNTSSGSFANPAPAGRVSQGIHGWNGVDLAAPQGSAINAAAAGTVIISRVGGWNGGYGNYVVIDHGNGVQTLYAHMSTDAVSVGDTVVRGQNIGTVGNTGQSTGYHLHFEVRGAKNPFAY
ncbi:MAG: peptidoglycan DD-metalloendopeptidase family protein [Patescibacteria group bacterium]